MKPIANTASSFLLRQGLKAAISKGGATKIIALLEEYVTNSETKVDDQLMLYIGPVAAHTLEKMKKGMSFDQVEEIVFEALNAVVAATPSILDDVAVRVAKTVFDAGKAAVAAKKKAER